MGLQWKQLKNNEEHNQSCRQMNVNVKNANTENG